MRILIAGCGGVGTVLGLRLAAAGHEVLGLRRSAVALPAPLETVTADLTRPETLRALPGEIDAVFYTAAAGGRSDDAYRDAYVTGLANLLDRLAALPQAPRRLWFTSSTAVYAQRAGEWVDEASPTEPTGFSGRRLLEAEALVASAPFPGTVVRFGGIYGPRRTGLLDRVRSGRARIAPGPPRYTNRIHEDDCADALAHLLETGADAACYLGVDHAAAPEREVLTWLAQRLGAPAPGEAPAAPGSRRAASNKRCRNARLLASGYRFRFPTYREGYGSILAGAAS